MSKIKFSLLASGAPPIVPVLTHVVCASARLKLARIQRNKAPSLDGMFFFTNFPGFIQYVKMGIVLPLTCQVLKRDVNFFAALTWSELEGAPSTALHFTCGVRSACFRPPTALSPTVSICCSHASPASFSQGSGVISSPQKSGHHGDERTDTSDSRCSRELNAPNKANRPPTFRLVAGSMR